MELIAIDWFWGFFFIVFVFLFFFFCTWFNLYLLLNLNNKAARRFNFEIIYFGLVSTFCEAGGSSKKGLERVMRYTKKKKTVMIRMLDNDVGVSCYSLMT